MYSYSYLASAMFFSEYANLAPVATIAAVFEEIINKHASFGVVPIENSTDGRIVDTITMFAKSPVRICGEILLPIHHCLLGRCSRAEIREVYSKPQAISQCRHWLSQHLPDAKLFEIASTTAAAKLAAEKPNVAAIASIEAGMHYGLNVIQANIEDNRDNVTRFAVLGNDKPERTGNDKTSIMMQIPHRSGALAEALHLFSCNKMNLTWIESFPIPGNTNEYVFFIEVEGHQVDQNVATGLEQLSKQTLRLEILGSYPKGKM
jgi:chorismate mutase/prephenate dehydratase